jgi:High potential iron-sulfur protein
MSVSRRAFIADSVLLITAAGVPAAAWSQSGSMVSESDPTAMALGYKADATQVDTKKFPRYAAGQSCSNCALYSGAAGASSGPCQIFGGKLVAARGWCASYTKKP